MKPEAEELAQERMRKARQALSDARLLFGAQSYFGTINRVYYSAFYAARALLATKELDAGKHAGVIALFNQHFVKEGIVTKIAGRILGDLFGLRIEGDYEDFKAFKKEEAAEALLKCETFLLEIEKILTNHIN
jgi:uncharacterized protein (UPF0332 family)